MKKRVALLSVALGTVCLANSADAIGNNMSGMRDSNKIRNSIDNTSSKSSSNPVWPDSNAIVKCAGINSCKGKGSCQGASNSCAGQNPCKGKGLVSVTSKECKDKKGTVVTDSSQAKGKK